MTAIDLNITEGSTVRVRGLGSGRPPHATVTKLYANGKDVGVKFTGSRYIALMGKGQLKVALANVSLV